VSPSQIEDFLALVSNQDNTPPERYRREMDQFVAGFPQILLFAEKLLWEEGHEEAGVAFLFGIGTPAAYDILHRFGLSQVGDDDYGACDRF
jgi:hypothetical protein